LIVRKRRRISKERHLLEKRMKSAAIMLAVGLIGAALVTGIAILAGRA
jgi:hypothetical protein